MVLPPFFYFFPNLMLVFRNISIETPIFAAPKGNGVYPDVWGNELRKIILNKGVIAQLVEQWTENPCVAGSTPARTTKPPVNSGGLFITQPFFPHQQGCLLHLYRLLQVCKEMQLRHQILPACPIFWQEWY